MNNSTKKYSNFTYYKNNTNSMNQDICELIANGKCVIITNNNLQELSNFLNKNPVTYRLDLHNVLDTINCNIQFDNPQDVCCISYVGRYSNLRSKARQEMINRTGTQIKFGILVFARGRNHDRLTFHEVGSKAWINKLLPFSEKALFVDDGYDHCESVKSLNILNLSVYCFKESDDIYKLVNENNNKK